MRTAALITLTAAILAGFVAAWNWQHAWPEWDKRATEYPEWRP